MDSIARVLISKQNKTRIKYILCHLVCVFELEVICSSLGLKPSLAKDVLELSNSSSSSFHPPATVCLQVCVTVSGSQNTLLQKKQLLFQCSSKSIPNFDSQNLQLYKSHLLWGFICACARVYVCVCACVYMHTLILSSTFHVRI